MTDAPFLKNPTDPALIRLKARLEGEPVVVPRELRRGHKGKSNATANARQKDSLRHARRRAQEKTAVAVELVDPHLFIQLTQKAYEKAKPDEAGILIPGRSKGIRMDVSRDTIDRAMLIMDTLLKAIISAGYKPELNTGSMGLFVIVDDEMISFRMQEITKSREILVPPDKKGYYTYERKERQRYPTGCLRLSIDGIPGGPKTSWTDGQRWIVEDCIDSFIRALPKAAARAKAIRAEEVERRRATEERERQWAIREESRKRQERLIAEEKDRIRLLDGDLERMAKADAIRSYAERMNEAVCPEGACLVPWHGPGYWIRWCHCYADRLDPSMPNNGLLRGRGRFRGLAGR